MSTGCTTRWDRGALIRWWFVHSPCLNKLCSAVQLRPRWVSLPPAASINQHCCSCLWVRPQRSTSASLAVALDPFSPPQPCSSWHETGQPLRHTPPPPPPQAPPCCLHFQTSPPVLTPMTQSSEHPATKSHFAVMAKCRILDKKRHYRYKWGFTVHLFSTLKSKKEHICNISKYNLEILTFNSAIFPVIL